MEPNNILPLAIFAGCGVCSLYVGFKGLFYKVPTVIRHRIFSIVCVVMNIGLLLFVLPGAIDGFRNSQNDYLYTNMALVLGSIIGMGYGLRGYARKKNGMILLGANVKQYSQIVENALVEMNIAFKKTDSGLSLIDRNINLALSDELRGSGMSINTDKAEGENIVRTICSYVNAAFVTRHIKRSFLDKMNSIYFIMVGIFFVVLTTIMISI